jgi:hypothetical protein
MATNLPSQQIEDSAAGTKLYFDSYGEAPLEFNAGEVSASVLFFEKKGFDKDAALVVATTILKQAKLDNTPVFKILDTLTGFDNITLSSLVGEILNNNRTSTSTLGFRTNPVTTNIVRNIAP